MRKNNFTFRFVVYVMLIAMLLSTVLLSFSYWMQ